VAELLSSFEPEIETLTLIPAHGGRFEVDVNGVLLYSKVHTGRHAKPGEVVGLVKEYLMKRG
jgi:selenoprotein W-related protein